MAASQGTPPLDTWQIQPYVLTITWTDTWHAHPLSGRVVQTQWLASQTRFLTAFCGQSLLISPKAYSTGPSWVSLSDLSQPVLRRL